MAMGSTQRSRRKRVVVSSDEDEPPRPKKPSRARAGAVQTTLDGGTPKKTARRPSNTPSPRKTRSGSGTNHLTQRSISQYTAQFSNLPTRPAASPPNSTKSSPAKSQVGNGKSKAKKIFSFFNSAALSQKSKSAKAKEPETDEFDLEDDLIQDDDILEAKRNISPSPTKGISIKKGNDACLKSIVESSSAHSKGSRRFLNPNNSFSSSAPSSVNASILSLEENRPWTEQYRPLNLDELAVHKKKVNDVRSWITSALAGKTRQRLLVLKGGSGSGKTITTTLIARELGLTVSEWKNPDSALSGGSASAGAQFEDFIGRVSAFAALDFEGESSTSLSVPQNNGKSVILVEEYPSTYSRSSSALQSFRQAILRYLALATPSLDAMFSSQRDKIPKAVPIIMVISESLLSTVTATSDSFTAHRLLGQDILNHPGVSVLEFNPVAPTFMVKAMELILKKEAMKSGRRFTPGPSVLKHLAESGDVRSATAALEFFCLYRGSKDDWSGNPNSKLKRGAAGAPLTTREKESLEVITHRESTLGIFHAVGKVIYNRRDASLTEGTPPPQPPSHLPQHARHKPLEVNMESLLNELGTDIPTFIAALHENYVLSCGGMTDEETLDSVTGCIDSLSCADLLSPDRFSSNRFRHAFQGTGMDSLRQQELSFETSARGLLFNLPHPVKRIALPPEYHGGRIKNTAMAAHQILYPTSLKLWRQKEQIEETLRVFVSKFREGNLVGESSQKKASENSGRIEEWSRYTAFSGSKEVPQDASKNPDEPCLLMNGAISHEELLLEQLPYLYIMQRRNRLGPPLSKNAPAIAKQLEKVVKMGGLVGILNGNGNEDDDEDAEVPDDGGGEQQWSTDQPVDEKQKRLGNGQVLQVAENGNLLVKKTKESLVLSDDDIEDD